MNNLKEVVKAIYKSEYLCDWILKLKESKELFSPEKNILPCIVEDEKYRRSSYWLGLDLLTKYCDLEKGEDEIDDFIINLLEKSISIYQSDKEIVADKKLNSSYLITYNLIKICLSKVKFINNVDIVSLFKIYFDGVFSFDSLVISLLSEKKEILLDSNVNSLKIAQIYSLIMDLPDNRFNFDNDLNIPEIIQKYSFDFFNLAKKIITTSKERFFDMGSFYEFNSRYSDRKLYVAFSWIKTSSLYLDNRFLISEIDFFIKSKSKLYRKIGLCLININFNRTKDLLINNIDMFFEVEDFYPDLKALIVKNLKEIKNEFENLFIQKIKEASFGLKDERQIFALKNHLLKNFAFCEGVTYKEETKEEIEFAENITKDFYIRNIDKNEMFQEIYKDIEGKEPEEIIRKYKYYKNSSTTLGSVVNKAFIKCLAIRFPLPFELLRGLGSGFSNSLILHFSNGEGKNYDNLYSCLKCVLSLMSDDSEFLGCLNTCLFEIKSNFDNFGEQKVLDLINLIDFKWIEINEYEDGEEDIITDCINESIYEYLEIICYIAFNNLQIKEKFFEALNFYINKFKCKKLKSIISCILPKIFYLNKDYAKDLITYALDNENNGVSLSYPLLAIGGPALNKKGFLSLIYLRDDLRNYFLSSFKNNNLDMAQTGLMFAFFYDYVNGHNEFESLLRIVFESKSISMLHYILTMVNSGLENKQLQQDSEQIQRFANFLKISLEYKMDVNDSEIDQVIRQISKCIVLLNNKYSFMWDVLSQFFKNFNRFFADECLELVTKYLDIETKKMKKLLTLYFKSYKQYYSDEEQMKKILRLISNHPNYRNEYRQWKVYICEKNPDFNDFENY